MRSPAEILYNFHWIERGKAARSSQAYAGFLGPFLRAHGIRTLVNLRGLNPSWRWWHNEKRICAKLGIEHRDAMLSSKRLPTRKMLSTLIAALDETPKPLLVKCSGGQDRTSLAAALYIVHVHGWKSFAEAERQFARWPYLHLPRREQRWLKLFLTYARDEAGSRPLQQWVGESYVPEEFKAWLEARGEAQSFRGLYDPAQGL